MIRTTIPAMKTTLFRKSMWALATGKSAVAALLLLSGPVAKGASIVVDSFTNGPFSIDMQLGPGYSADVSPVGEWGTSRRVLLPRPDSDVDFMSSTLDPNSGGSMSLDFQMAAGEPPEPYTLTARYQEGGPYSILGQTAFEFDFSNISGVAQLIIILGDHFDPDSATIRTAITSPGTLSVPVSDVNFGPNGALDSFSEFYFIFETTTDSVSFSLDEIRVVPEPSMSALVAIGSLGLLRRSRKK